MPNIATQLYHKNPDLQIVLDFLDRCAPDDRRLVARYPDAHALNAVKAACAKSNGRPVDIHPMSGLRTPDAGTEKEKALPGLMLDREDWLVLAGSAMSQLAQELRKRLPAISSALKLVPVPWAALTFTDNALAEWGKAAGMIALPGRTVFDYLGSRYPSGAKQRGKYAIVRNVEHAAAYRQNHVLGFLLDKDGKQNFACQSEDWRSEMASARSLLEDHLSLMLKIALQMLEAGATGQLADVHTVLVLAGETPALVRLQTLLETYEDHVASYGAGQNRFRSKLLKNCMDVFQQWQANSTLVAREGPGVMGSRGPTGMMREWKWMDSSADAFGAPGDSAPAALAPATPPATTSTTTTTTTTGHIIPEGLVAPGVTIPRGVTVASGAHVRVCAISSGSCLKRGTVLHGDISIASHTRFDGPVTIMNDVRIGWGLTLGSRLILTEGATISSFTVKCRLPRGTRIGGSLRIGADARVDNNVSFGAENWIGEHVHIGENVRFGPYVKVDNGISIGANAWIKGYTRLIGNVPESAEVSIPAAEGNTLEERQASPAYAISIGGFAISKNETIRERPAMQRQPLAAELAIDNDVSNDMPEEGASPDRHAGSISLGQPQLLAVRSVAATNDPLLTPPTPSEVGRRNAGPESMLATPPVRPGAPAGLQRKRAGDPLVGRPAKQARIDLESRYREAESGSSPARVGHSAADPEQGKSFGLPRLLNKSAFMPIQASATSTVASASNGWLDRQRPAQRQSAIGSTPDPVALQPLWHGADSTVPEGQRTAIGASGGARQTVSEAAPDREAERLAWQKSVISKEHQNALERSTRQSIRVPAEGPRDKRQAPEPQSTARTLAPLYSSKGPTL